MSAGRWDTALYGAALLEIDAARARSKTREAYVDALRGLLVRARKTAMREAAKARNAKATFKLIEQPTSVEEAMLRRRSGKAAARAAQAEQLAYAVTDALVAEGAEDVAREAIGGAG